MDPQKIADVAAAVSAFYEADIFFYSGPIDDAGFAALIAAASLSSICRACILILTTDGGSVKSAFRIARFLQKKYERFILFAPSHCMSAGTLIALGANTLIMDLYSELGPLDVRSTCGLDAVRYRSDLPTLLSMLSRLSLEFVERAVGSLTRGGMDTRLAMDISVMLTSNLIRPIVNHIDVFALAEDLGRSETIIGYGRRLAEHGNNTHANAVETLVKRYPAHDFIIDSDEAKTLFFSVEAPSDDLYRLIDLLGEDVYKQEHTSIVHRLGGASAPRGKAAPETEEFPSSVETFPDETHAKCTSRTDRRATRSR